MPFIRTSFPSPILGHSCSHVCTILCIALLPNWLNLLLFTPLLSVFFHCNVNASTGQALFCSLYSQGLKQCLIYSRCSIVSLNKWWMYDSCKKNSDFTYIILFLKGLPRWLSEKNPPANAGDMGSIPGSGRSPGEGNGNPLQYSCLESSMERGAWRATVHRVAKGRTWLRY